MSPSKTGAGNRTSSQPRFAMTFTDRSIVDCPVTRARVNVESTSGLPNSVLAAYAESKWILLTFCDSSVNQTLSAASTVRPSGCR